MADTTILKYSFQPSEVFISTSGDLKLFIQNPADGKEITFKGGPQGDLINIIFPVGTGESDLVTELTFKADSPAGYNCAKSTSGDYFSIKFNNNKKLKPGETVIITFLSVKINDACKTPDSKSVITIQEFVGITKGDATSIIVKQPNNQLAINAWIDPLIVGLYKYATLYWHSIGGTKVVVSPFNSGDKTFPVVGPPPSPGNCLINIPSTIDSQRVYTLRVYTSDQNMQQVTVTLTQNPPLITTFTADKSGPIRVDESLVLDWFYLWGSTSSIDSNTGLQLNNPNPTATVSPGKELLQTYKNNYGNMPSSVYYELGVNGFKEPTSKRIQVDLLPVQLVYFKYAKNDNGKLSGMVWRFYPESWTATQFKTITNDLTQLTLYQPGGKTEIYYLGEGDTHPQIQYFNFTNKGSGNFELTWVTANLVSLKLTPGDYTVPDADRNKGTKSISISSSTVYTLTGKSADGSVITSSLNVTL